MAIIIERSKKQQLIYDMQKRVKEVREKGARPTIVLCLEALLYLLEKEEEAGWG